MEDKYILSMPAPGTTVYSGPISSTNKAGFVPLTPSGGASAFIFLWAFAVGQREVLLQSRILRPAHVSN